MIWELYSPIEVSEIVITTKFKLRDDVFQNAKFKWTFNYCRPLNSPSHHLKHKAFAHLILVIWFRSLLPLVLGTNLALVVSLLLKMKLCPKMLDTIDVHQTNKCASQAH
ncbi:unnamed protein product [Sphenostylis stenocarpa]|uniref:Uncharacterized protein n=1 Tax=Sphenostylis stenocarpa TaxID=92480 RepID=A0AA86SEK5_9FABA|nr:unnamed protein product [Sphenostylis stenocarpa]